MPNRFLTAIILFFTLFLSSWTMVRAQSSIQCPERFLTLVNPVRDRSLWADNTLGPLRSQYAEIARFNFPATWLMQYDTLKDKDLVSEVSDFGSNQEVGVFLEVSRGLAGDSGVNFPIYTRWSDPGTVFLSAYSQSERRKLIDKLFTEFKNVYGYYPKSVGAWWIDSYSLNYMVEKYKIAAVLIVADQKVTDSYGVWGQWWGFPYRPSKANILVPASSLENRQDVVVIQWAQRDPVLAYGGVGDYSGFSLQANDYIHVGQNINYFKNLVSKYLDCQNPLAQITVGLETGQESLSQPKEYQNQLSYLFTLKGLKAVTMSDFASEYKNVYEINPGIVVFGDTGAKWEMTTGYRKNDKLGDYIPYSQNLSFPDYYMKDNSNFLKRWLPLEVTSGTYFPVYLAIILVFLVISIKYKLFQVWAGATLTLLTYLGLLLRSNYQLGWQVFYGPDVGNLVLVQALAVVAVFSVFFLLNRFIKDKLFLWIIPLTFGVDRIISIFRYTNISGQRFFGFVSGVKDFYGFKLVGETISYVHEVFEPIQFQSLLRFDFSSVWRNRPLYFLVYPLLHVLLAFVIWKLIIKRSMKVKIFVLSLLIMFLFWQVNFIFNADPLSVRGIGR